MDDPSQSKKRRGLGVVTANACTECRKKRAKCDGALPCGRCKAQEADCRYELPVRQSKENMRAEIDQLRRRQDQRDRVLSALSAGDAPASIIQRLRSGEPVENISDSLESERSSFSIPNDRTSSGHSASASASSSHSGEPLHGANLIGPTPNRGPSFSNSPASAGGLHWTPQKTGAQSSRSQSFSRTTGSSSSVPQSAEALVWNPDHGNTGAFGSEHSQDTLRTLQSDVQKEQSMHSPRDRRAYGESLIMGADFRDERHRHTSMGERWTEVTNDIDFVHHLLTLYFCWEYPIFASLSKEHFLVDFREGRHRFCSPLLVNAILAVGCRFSDLPQARTDPDDSNTAGNHFFAESVRLLQAQRSQNTLTTIQALGLLAIRQASCGRASESIYYAGQTVKITMEMGLHLEDSSGYVGDDAEWYNSVRAATFWGAFSLDHAWSLCAGKIPHFSKGSILSRKPAIIEHSERSMWVPYVDDGAVPGFNPQLSNVRSVYRTFCELSEKVHNVLYVLYAPNPPLTAKSLLDVYTSYLNWYNAIPEALRLGHNFTPAILFVHMYYHYAILLLFRPFINVAIVGSSVSPRDVVTQAADAIATLINSYSQMFTLRRMPAFVPYFTFTAGIAQLITLGISGGGVDHFRLSLSNLRDMESSSGFTRRAREILLFLARQWEIDIIVVSSMRATERKRDSDTSTVTSSWDQTTQQQQQQQQQQPSQRRQSHLDLEGSYAYNFELELIATELDLERFSLFQPFPLQGQPLVREGETLETIGFRILSAPVAVGEDVEHSGREMAVEEDIG